LNFAGEFALLSEACTGYIFTFCSTPYRNLSVGGFRLYAARAGSGSITSTLKRLWVQIALPLWLLWGRERVDAIIAWDPYASGLVGSVLKLLFRSRLIVDVVGDYHKLEPSEQLVYRNRSLRPAGNALKRSLMSAAFGITVRYADALKVVNSSLEEFFRRRYPASRTYRFPSFVATNYFQSLDSHQGDYLLSVGYPFHLKGMDVLIRAFRSISPRHPGVRLKIMGYASEEELKTYRPLAEGDSRIEFLKPGWIEDVGEQMRGCYALVNAARSEAAGRVHFEAMACRKPVVATRTSGGLDYIRDGETGLLCEIDDIEDLARKLDCLLSNPKLAVAMGEAGFERLQREFSEEHYKRAFLTRIAEVVNVDGREIREGVVF
jgi:glycosyltransferase involved in cell wall biosynthesis